MFVIRFKISHSVPEILLSKGIQLKYILENHDLVKFLKNWR